MENPATGAQLQMLTEVLGRLPYPNITVVQPGTMMGMEPLLGKQEGANRAMMDGVRNGWFNASKWVIRLNPDVVIHDFRPLLSHLRNEAYQCVLANCSPLPYCTSGQPCDEALVHTDFFAIQPPILGSTALSWERGFPRNA